ncbi:MAG: hypothetical protein C0424_03905 [Sphingobacteriaceae bacterium]|nr:hypothetical protein [Sphingobacteriaceae bacterium]
MKHAILLCLFLMVGTWQTHAQSAAQQTYDRESILLEPSSGKFFKGNAISQRMGIFGQRLLPHLRSDEALVVMGESVRHQRIGYWTSIAGLGLVFVIPFVSTPAILASLGGIIVLEGISYYHLLEGDDKLQQAVWLHNRAILADVPATNR